MLPDKGLRDLKQASAAGAGLLAAQVLALLSVLVVSNSLGPVNYGRYGLAMVASIVAYQFAHWGIDPFFARILAHSSAEVARRHLASFVLQRVMASIVTAAVGFGVVFLFFDADRVLLCLGLADGALLSFTIAPAFDIRERTAVYYFFSAIRQLSYLAAVYSLVSAYPVHTSPSIVVVIHMCAIGVQLALEWTWVWRNYGALEWAGAPQGARDLWLSSIPMALAAGALQLLGVLGPPCLEMFGMGPLGYLVISNQLAVVMTSFLDIPGRLLHVRLLSDREVGTNFFRRRVAAALVLFTLVGILVAAILSNVAEAVIYFLFGENYRPAARIFAVDVWRAVGVLASGVMGSALICQNRIRIFAACHVLALLLAGCIAIYFVPKQGGLAAAAAVACGRGTFALLAAIVFFLPVSENAR